MKYFFEYEVMNLETQEVLAQCEFEEKLAEHEIMAFDNFFKSKKSMNEAEYQDTVALRDRILNLAIEMEKQNPAWDEVRDKIMITISSASCEDTEADQMEYDQAEENLNRLLYRVGKLNYERTGTITDRAFEMNRRCKAVNVFLDVMDAIDHLTERNVPRNKAMYKVPLRYEVLSVVMAMGHAYGAATDEEVKNFCGENMRENCVPYDSLGMDEATIRELSDYLRKHFEKICDEMEERLKLKLEKLRREGIERETVVGEMS